jgi:hypothetical membrane protein
MRVHESIWRVALYLAPIVLVVMVTWLGANTPGYSHTQNWISALAQDGAPQQALAQWGLFGGFGFSLLVAGVASPHIWGRDKKARITGLVFWVAGLCIWGTGYFNCDEGCPIFTTSPKQLAHNGLAVVAFSGLMGLQVLHAWPGAHKGRGATYQRACIPFAALSVLSFALIQVAIFGGINLDGLFQRVFVASPCGWLVMTGVVWPYAQVHPDVVPRPGIR